ncbi:hypothetical protein COJ85_17255 [Bacillus sp. AFS076308]|nr:hypothetical protein [Bacillus sp. AFS076308]PFO01460.1 hypothetical protein COJ85_17255 [Bacillus sp. AFS076308]
MSEKINENENNEQNTGLTIDKERLRNLTNLTNNLTKNDNALDLGPLVRMASTLLTNQSVLNTVSELTKTNQNDIQDPPNSSELKEQTEHDSFSEKLEEIVNNFSVRTLEISNEISALKEIITNELTDLKNELYQVKKQNKYLKELTKEIYKNQKNKK